jgi:chromate transporter
LYAGAGISLRRRKSRDLAGKMLPGHRSLSTTRAMREPSGSATNAAACNGSAAEVFAVFLWLGLTSFGGPIAHLGYFHEEFVVRRKWLDEKTYVDLVALSQFLPGPASSKVGIALGLSRAGYAGGLAA